MPDGGQGFQGFSWGPGPSETPGESDSERPVAPEVAPEVAQSSVPSDHGFRSRFRIGPRPQHQLGAQPTPQSQSQPRSRLRKALTGVGVGVVTTLVAVLALGGLFVAGRTLAPVFAAPVVVGSAPSMSAVPSPELSSDPSASPELEVLGPVAPGSYGWNDLLGTECVDPWGSAWDQVFMVVECGEPHAAQLVYRGTFVDSATAAHSATSTYPGVDELQSRMNLLCASPKNIDYSAAKRYEDIELSASFAANESQWLAGDHDYFCFVSRSSGKQLAIDVAKPDRRAAPVEPKP